VTAPESSRLARRLADEIRGAGPMRFDRFQAAALYDPDGGYYERPSRVGREGDFVTGASWHPAFARALLRLCREVARETGRPASLLDVGAGEGELLGHLRREAADVALSGVEVSAVRRRAASGSLPGVPFHASLGELPSPVHGVVVAYELVDALPVRALETGEEGEILERLVSLGADGEFRWTTAPCADAAAIAASLPEGGRGIEPGQRFEIRPGAASLCASLARALGEGLLLVFDYGAPARALYGPARPGGTLEAFLHHRVTRDVLSEPGSRDVTAWVDFTEVGDALRGAGLDLHGLVSQSRLLLGLGLAGEIADAGDPFERNALAKLVAPGGMGESLRVLVATRGASSTAARAVRPLGEP